MRTWIGGVLLFCVLFIPALFGAQAVAMDMSPWEVSAGYTYVRANEPPGGCGCFSLNGGNGSVAYHFNSHIALAGDIAVVTNGDLNLTLTSYQVGPRYTLPLGRGLTPFGQVLVGGAHASGSAAASGGITGGSSDAFAATMGGGLDLNATHAFSLRLFEVDYYLTHFPNGVNDHENNLRVSVGAVFHFGH